MIKEIAAAHTRLAMTGSGLCKALLLSVAILTIAIVAFAVEDTKP
jgi:hypothetical protein